MDYEPNDAADVDDIYETDDPDPLGIPPVPVAVAGVVGIDQRSTHLAQCERRTIVLDATAVKVVNEDPRRARLTLWALSEDIIIGRSQAEADMGVGAHLTGGLGLPLQFTFRDELWARTDPDSATADGLLSIVSEQWTH